MQVGIGRVRTTHIRLHRKSAYGKLCGGFLSGVLHVSTKTKSRISRRPLCVWYAIHVFLELFRLLLFILLLLLLCRHCSWSPINHTPLVFVRTHIQICMPTMTSSAGATARPIYTYPIAQVITSSTWWLLSRGLLRPAREEVRRLLCASERE